VETKIDQLKIVKKMVEENRWRRRDYGRKREEEGFHQVWDPLLNLTVFFIFFVSVRARD